MNANDPNAFEPIENASLDELRELQLERMRWSLRHAYDNVPFYRQKFEQHQVLSLIHI